jgi:hypothetical protein
MVHYGPHQAMSDATPIARGNTPLTIPILVLITMDPRSPANRGWRWGWTTDPRQIGDGTPIPDPRQIWDGDGDGDGDRGFRALVLCTVRSPSIGF